MYKHGQATCTNHESLPISCLNQASHHKTTSYVNHTGCWYCFRLSTCLENIHVPQADSKALAEVKDCYEIGLILAGAHHADDSARSSRGSIGCT